MKILDNINHTVREDLQDTMQKGSRVSIKVFNMSDCWKIAITSEMNMLNYSIRR